VPIRVLPSNERVACELDLVGGVVRVEPRSGTFTKAGLQEDSREDEERHDAERQGDERPRRRQAADESGCRGGGNQERSQNRERAHKSQLPLSIRKTDKRSKGARWLDLGRSEHPRIRAEERDLDQRKRAKRGKHEPPMGGILVFGRRAQARQLLRAPLNATSNRFSEKT
jgi:hypothetical protein